MNQQIACPGCGMRRSAWTANNGEGYEKHGYKYCCRSCAEGMECTCR